MQDIKLVFMPAGQPSAGPLERRGARGIVYTIIVKNRTKTYSFKDLAYY